MRLVRMILRNFKGVTAFEFEPNGNNAAVFGDNGKGKTTLADAFGWLTNGKDTLGRQCNPKPLDIQGAEVHNLETTVEAELVDDAGATTALKKTQSEIWKGERGHSRKYSGNTNSYMVNGVPVQEGEFVAQLAQICPPDKVALLTDPDAFAGKLEWKKRRALLLDICGDVTDADVIASDKALAPLTAILANQGAVVGKTPMEARRATVDGTLKTTKDELKLLPARIDEVKRSIAGIVWEDTTADEELKATKEARRAELQADRARTESGDATQGLRRELLEAQGKVRTARQAVEDAARRQRQAEEDRISAARGKLASAVTDAREALRQAENTIRATKEQLAGAERGLAALEPQLKAAGEAYDRLDETEWTGSTECPTCHQEMPAHMVAEAKASWNEGKARDLEALDAKGLQLKADIEAVKTRIETLTADVTAAADRRNAAEEALAKAEVALQNAEQVPTEWPAPDYANDADVQAWALDVDCIQVRIKEAEEGSGTAAELARIDAELAKVEAEIGECDTRLEQARARKKGEARIKELEEEQRRLGGVKEDLEQEIALHEAFVRAKVALLTDRVNSRFQLARFRLFRELVNGGLEDCCDVTYQGVPYGAGLNTGARINVGLDCIRTLSAHFGVTLPVFCDGAESVTRLIETPSQTIRLVVEAGADALRVEVAAPQGDLFGREAA